MSSLRGKGAKRWFFHKSRPWRFGVFGAGERKVMAFGTTISFLSVPTSPLNGFYVATVRTAGIAYFLCIKDESTSGLKVFSYSINENRHFTNPKVSGADARSHPQGGMEVVQYATKSSPARDRCILSRGATQRRPATFPGI